MRSLRSLLSVLVAVALLSLPSAAQNTTNVTLAHLLAGGVAVPHATVCAEAADGSTNPISVSSTGWGLLLKDYPLCGTVVNGAMAGGLNVPDAAHTTSAAAILYNFRIQVTNAGGIPSGPAIFLKGVPNVTGPTFALDTYTPTVSVTIPPTGIVYTSGTPTSCTSPSIVIDQTAAAAFMCIDGTLTGLAIAGSVATATYATTAGYAATAGSAASATSATSATTATTATNATNATYATTAGSAATATTATSAATATTATSATTAATATALAAAPTGCPAGEVSNTFDAQGNATNCFTPAGSAGAVTSVNLSVPSRQTATGGGAGAVALAVTDNAQSPNTFLRGPASGSSPGTPFYGGLVPSDITFTLNQSTDGEAATAAALAATPVLCPTGQSPTGILPNGNATGCASITASITSITSLTGDVTASGPGSATATLATVNTSPGTCGDSTHICQVTTNAKGLTTGQSAIAIAGVTPAVLRGSNQATSGATSGVTSLTVAFPAGSSVGDLAIIFSGSICSFTVPTGWTNLSLANGLLFGSFGASKILTSGDIATGSVTVTYTTYGGSAYDATLDDVVFVGPTGGIREIETQFNSGTSSYTLTTSSSVLATDVALYFSYARANTSLSIVPASGSATTLDLAYTTGLTGSGMLVADQAMPGGAFTVTYNFPGGGEGLTYTQIIVEGVGVLSNANAGFQVSGTTFAASGCSNTTLVGGSTGGSFYSGTTGTCTVTVTMGNAVTAAHGWACFPHDLTTPADAINETATTTTTVTFSGTTASGDVINFGCMAY